MIKETEFYNTQLNNNDTLSHSFLEIILFDWVCPSFKRESFMRSIDFCIYFFLSLPKRRSCLTGSKSHLEGRVTLLWVKNWYFEGRKSVLDRKFLADLTVTRKSNLKQNSHHVWTETEILHKKLVPF